MTKIHGNSKYHNILTKKFLIKQYTKNKKSPNQIARELNCGITTIFCYLKKFNIKIRDIKAKNNVNYKNGLYCKNRCIDCNKIISELAIRCKSCAIKGKNHPNFNKFGKETSGWKGKKAKHRKKYYCKKCGKEITISSKSGLCHSCDLKKRLKDPRNHPMFGKVAKNGNGKYYKQSYMKSSYEIAYANYCLKNQIKYRYEPKTFDLGNSTYTPDFYLPEQDLWIEIKGWWRDKYKKKFRKFKRKFPNINIKILMKPDLQKLGVL